MFGLVEERPKLLARKDLLRLKQAFPAGTIGANSVQREPRVTSSAYPFYQLRVEQCDMVCDDIARGREVAGHKKEQAQRRETEREARRRLK